MNKSQGYYLIKKLKEIHEAPLEATEKFSLYYKILEYVFNAFTSHANIQLTSLFTKMAFIGNHYKVNRQLMYHLHAFRKRIQTGSKFEENEVEEWEDKISQGLRILITELWQIPLDYSLKENYFRQFGTRAVYQDTRMIPSVEFFARELDEKQALIKGSASIEEFGEVTLKCNVEGKNEIYWESLLECKKLDLYPIPLYLHQIEVVSEEVWIPHMIVIQPSFLIDVTTVAECFKDYGTEPLLSVVRMYLPARTNKYLLLGHIANYMLDSIITNPEIGFDEIRNELFQLAPMQFSLLSDELVREIVQKAYMHFSHLKKTITKELLQDGIERSNVYIEPAFLAPEYGIQGRLDLFHLNEKEKKAAIIELKSGSAFKVNHYGLSNNHYVQTLLYDLMIQATYGTSIRRNNFILYSGEKSRSLRYAPTVKFQQMEAVRTRNEILLQHYKMETCDRSPHLLDLIKSRNFQKISGFQKEEVRYFEKIYLGLDQVSKAYFDHFTAFAAKERRMAKIGVSEDEGFGGLASIWTKTLEEKIENFDILNHLVIRKNQSDENIPVLCFEKTSGTARLSNFRPGDIAVIYPDLDKKPSALYSQIFKCTVLDLSDDHITVRLRSRQFNFEIFKRSPYWHLEHDVLDSSFNAMYRSLFEFACAPENTRKLLLGLTPPQKGSPGNLSVPDQLSPEQGKLFCEIIGSRDYYLLWGPPGTGKTNIMIHHLIDYYFHQTRENILVLAYTNRAVDEICDAISRINPQISEHFIRIGSRYSTKEPYQKNLLDNKIAGCAKRPQVLRLIENTRLFVGTLASTLGKNELFALKKFDCVMIDEASQILEPHLIGLLTRFSKCILIGDHRQLPAIVRQNPEKTKVRNKALLEIGLENLRDSLFERLYKRSIKNNWHFAFGQLHHQGRMHNELMKFVNQAFYQNSLRIFENIPRLHGSMHCETSSSLGKLVFSYRMLYFPTPAEENGTLNKTNLAEAELILRLVMEILNHSSDGLSGECMPTIGIITPYRAQIALLRTLLNQSDYNQEQISIDTVERYQGSARDVIIISFCMNHPSQLNSLISLSADGVDRKLNVALTRAREQIILVGNEKILSRNPLYAELLGCCYRSEEQT